jgi:hypothetical protein
VTRSAAVAAALVTLSLVVVATPATALPQQVPTPSDFDVVAEAELSPSPGIEQIAPADLAVNKKSLKKKAVDFSAKVGELGTAFEAQLGDRFVGAWIDPEKGDVLYVRVTGDPKTIRSEALKQLRKLGRVKLVHSDVSLAALELERTAIDALGQSDPTIGVAGSWIDPASAKVVVEVDGNLEIAQGRVAATASHVIIRAAQAMTHTAVRDTLPVSGGDVIWNPATNKACTTALVVKRSGWPTLVTAGHCGGVGSQWSLGLTTIGSMSVSQNTNGIDAALIPLTTGQYQECILVQNGSCRPLDFTRRTIYIGMAVSKTGNTTGDQSGIITNTNASGQVVTNAYGNKGDSGGLLFTETGSGSVYPIGITSGCAPSAELEPDGQSYKCLPQGDPNVATYFTNWTAACATFSIDAAYCPASSNSPIGTFEFVAEESGKIRASGWALDPDNTNSATVKISANATRFSYSANTTRTDIGALFPRYGNNHGFSALLNVTKPGLYNVCVSVVNVGLGADTSLGCRSVRLPIRSGNLGGGSSCNDLLARKNTDLYFYAGNCASGLGSGKKIGNGWHTDYDVLITADLDSNNCGEVVTRKKSTGQLLAYPSNCATTPILGSPIQIGNGWSSAVFDQIFSGDFDSDGCDDIMTRRMDTASLWLYPGSCNFAFKTPYQIGNGWSGLFQELHASDTNGDGCTDIVTRRADSPYKLVSYHGGCNGTISGSKETYQGMAAPMS